MLYSPPSSEVDVSVAQGQRAFDHFQELLRTHQLYSPDNTGVYDSRLAGPAVKGHFPARAEPQHGGAARARQTERGGSLVLTRMSESELRYKSGSDSKGAVAALGGLR
jgi:hypothetical protein